MYYAFELATTTAVLSHKILKQEHISNPFVICSIFRVDQARARKRRVSVVMMCCFKTQQKCFILFTMHECS